MNTNDPVSLFLQECKNRVENFSKHENLNQLAQQWMNESIIAKYPYNFTSLGRPIIQYPEDMVAVQEVIFKVKPDLIIETGIAHGGSIIQSASQLAMLDMLDAIEQKDTFNPSYSNRKVIAIDIDIRAHNRKLIEEHPMASRIHMIEGSSVDPQVVDQVHTLSKDYNNIMVMLDSNHVHQHVLDELKAYASLTSVGSYCIVFDTFVENTSDDTFPNRPWQKGNNPMTAVFEYLKQDDRFISDHSVCHKLLITGNPNGYLKRIS